VPEINFMLCTELPSTRRFFQAYVVHELVQHICRMKTYTVLAQSTGEVYVCPPYCSGVTASNRGQAPSWGDCSHA